MFQRLNQAGWSHSAVSISYIAATLLLAFTMLIGGWPWVLAISVVELLVGFWLDQSFALSFSVASEIS